MKIVKIVPSPALLPAPGPIPPREPGRLTAAVGTSPEPRLRTAVYPPREVKARQSFAGGFQFPRKSTQQLTTRTRYDDLNERANETAWQYSGNAIQSLEEQVAKLRQESEGLKPRSHRDRIESLLHLDSPDVYHSHHHPTPQTAVQTMSLEQLQYLRTQHAKKLTEIEAEYARGKHEGGVWGSAELNFRRSAFSEVSKSQSRPKVPTEMRERYERRFEDYLEKKRGRPSTQPAQSSPITRSVDLEPFLSYIFKKVDEDKTGRIDKMELMQELHHNPELAHLLGFGAVAVDPDYLAKFEQLFESLGHGNEVTFPQFLAFFAAK